VIYKDVKTEIARHKTIKRNSKGFFVVLAYFANTTKNPSINFYD